MEDFRRQLMGIRCRNNKQNHYFYPHRIVHQLVTSKVIHEILKNEKVEPYAIKSAAQYLLNTGGRRIFAILALVQRPQLILHFIKDDQLQQGDPDHKLPFKKELLEDLIPSPTSEDFWDKQWEFTAPFFSESVFARVLPDEFILPFLNEEDFGEGALGRVYKVQIEQSYLPPGPSWQGEVCILAPDESSLQLTVGKIVRKELKARGDTRADFEKELYNLSMLKMLKHPNIVEMLAAYTFKDKHNLLFRKADGMTLGELLENPPQPPFRSLAQMIIALAGLFSALHAVHNFRYPDLQVLAIGCHHDLKPDNILIHRGSFLLADFGLSTFKDSSKASETSFKQVRGDYVAPECENFLNLSEQSVIGRSSDIWSLGCIILELLTHVTKGPKGVTDFEMKRSFKVGDHKRHRFHHGLGVESPAVTLQLDQLQSCMNSRAGRKILMMTRKMLNLNPKQRPSAAVLDEQMQHITIEVMCEDVHQLCSRIFKNSKSMQAWLVLSKFTSWMQICQVHQHDLLERWNPHQYPNYQVTKKCLHDLQQSLTAVLPDCERHLSHIYRPLHDLNQILYEALPTDMQAQAEVIFTVQTLDIADNDGLKDLADSESCPRDQAEISVLARIKLLKALIDDESIVVYPDLKIDPSRIKREKTSYKNDESAGRHTLGIFINERNEPVRVLVEYKEYPEENSEQILTELVNRLSKITKLLQEAGPGSRTLNCFGFYHDPSRDSCGLVYQYPPSTIPLSEMKFTTLKAGLDQYYRKSMPYLALETRFRLAYELAVSLLNFHEAGWMQKNISSFTIGFFHHKDEPWFHSIGRPYFVGFMYSRPSDDSATTEYIENPLEVAYQHPEYLAGRGNVRYRLQFDYYSLGLILLEIGRWQSLEHMSEKTDSRAGMRDKLRTEKVKRLSQNMGSIYQNVTALCLGDEFSPSSGTDDSSAGERVDLLLKFSSQVVNQLAKCTV